MASVSISAIRFSAWTALASLLARGQPVRDLLLAIFDGTHERRPDVLSRRSQMKTANAIGLHQQRQIDVHDCALTQRVVAPALAAAQFALLTSSIILARIPAFAGMTQLFPIAATPRVLLLDICVT